MSTLWNLMPAGELDAAQRTRLAARCVEMADEYTNLAIEVGIRRGNSRPYYNAAGRFLDRAAQMTPGDLSVNLRTERMT